MFAPSENVVLFKNPSGESSVFVRPVAPGVVRETVQAVFSQFGLLHSINFFAHDSGLRYALVQWYTPFCARAAVQKFARCGVMLRPSATEDCLEHEHEPTNAQPIVSKVSMFMSRSTRLRSVHYKPLLCMTRTVELANYYLGFNMWSSRIISVSEVAVTSADPFTGRCSAVVEVELRSFQLSHRAAGHARATVAEGIESKDKLIQILKKRAVNTALIAVFARLAIVFVDGRPCPAFVDNDDGDTADGAGEWDDEARVFDHVFDHETHYRDEPDSDPETLQMEKEMEMEMDEYADGFGEYE